MSKNSENASPFDRFYQSGREKAMDTFNELMSNPKFAQAMASAFQKALQTKGKIDENLQTILGFMNLPTRADYDRLAKKVGKLNRSIDDLENQIGKIAEEIEDLAEKSKKKSTAKKSSSKKSASKKSGTKKSGSKKSQSKKSK